MKKIFMIPFLLLMVGILSACGQKVEVPPASKGMILGPNGYQGDIIPPSKFRLDWCFFLCDSLVVVQAGDTSITESMQVLMPKDNLMVGIDVRFTLGLSSNDAALLSVFDRISPDRSSEGFSITLDNVYRVYGAAIVRNVVRSVISKYTVAELAASQGEISEILRQEVVKVFEKTPLTITQFGLANISYPDVVIAAMEATQARRIAIEQAEANAQVSIREAQARLEVSRANREADLLEAKTIREADEILAGGVTPDLIRYRELQVLEKMADNQNAVFFPVDMIGSQGLEYRVLNTKNQDRLGSE